MNPAVQFGVPVFAAAITGASALYVGVRKRHAPGARGYALMLACEMWWAVGYAFELLAEDLRGKVFWDNVQLPPAYLVALAFVLFTVEYTGRKPAHWRLVLGLLAIAPALATIWVFTDSWHGKARDTAKLLAAPPYNALTYEFTLIEQFAYYEAVVLAGLSVIALLDHARRQNKPYRPQSWAVAFGGFLVLVAEMPGLALGLDLWLLGQRDSSPVWFSISGVLIGWGVSRFQLFELVPIARDAVLEQMPDAVVVIDAQERVVDQNPAACTLLGKDPLIGAPLSEAFSTWPALLEALSKHAQRMELPSRDGEQIYELRSIQLETDKNNGGRALVLRDVTASIRARDELEKRVRERTVELSEINRKLQAQVTETSAAQAAAQASEHKFRAILDGASSSISMLAPDGTLIATNQASLRLIAAAPEDVLEKPFWDTPWWSHSDTVRAELREHLERASRGEFVRFETSQTAKIGDAVRTFDFSLTPTIAPDGKVISLVAEGRDISQRKRAEEANEKLKSQLFQAQKLESIGTLAGGIAHDFNNLLTVILGNVQLARVPQISAARRDEALLEVEQAATSAATLTRQLLTFARRTMVEPKILDLNETVRSVRNILSRLLGEDISLHLDLTADLWRTRLDRAQAEQIVVNLAVNARDAMPNGGTLTIITKNVQRHPKAESEELTGSTAEYVALMVEDSGVGMSHEMMAHIFEPFFTTKSPGSGTGLGLATVYGIVKHAGGFVEVSSTEGAGTKFCIYVPRSYDARDVAISRVSTLAPARGSELIALVEDQALVRATVRQQLESLGYRVRDFASAEQARASLTHESLAAIDLLLTDIVLSGVSGRQLAEDLQKVRPSLPVVFMSGYTEDIAIRHGVAVGTVWLLEKPFNLEQLGTCLREALQSTRVGERTTA